MELGDELILAATEETALPRARIEGERGRTVGQLKLFADVLREGSWQNLRHDPALPERTPPRPDLRLRSIAVGPVAVFGASNFPLAFSTAGGDTASALAAGCPVIVKGHSAHPRTSQLAADAVLAAARACNLPEGVFAHLLGPGKTIGAALAANPYISAIGFTGSRAGGLALRSIAQSRAVPIPVYAEMSSINPTLLFPAALEERAEELAAGFVGSMTLGAGQFCTNPGLVVSIDGPALERFLKTAGESIERAAAAPMLTETMAAGFCRETKALAAHADVTVIARGHDPETSRACPPWLFVVEAASFLKDAALGEELFGAASTVLRCRDIGEMREVVSALEGQLTATMHIAGADETDAATFVPLLERKAGRLLVNGWPTGVEVCHAMVHGGPFPATSDPRATSVGSMAIERFLRPVCYQGFPQGLLPDPLSDGELGNSPYRVNGALA